eukprot:COSAG03_NODE_23002_length_284_cov_0.945946_1_plen_70_part_10
MTDNEGCTTPWWQTHQQQQPGASKPLWPVYSQYAEQAAAYNPLTAGFPPPVALPRNIVLISQLRRDEFLW